MQVLLNNSPPPVISLKLDATRSNSIDVKMSDSKSMNFWPYQTVKEGKVVKLPVELDK